MMITINDKTYDPDDLTPEQVSLFNQAMSAQTQARQAESNAQIFRVAEGAFAEALAANIAASEKAAAEVPQVVAN
jgi:hypothetical protein